MCCPGCSSASCSPLSAPSMDQRGGGEWLCCSSLHRANATYALAQSLRFFCLEEEPSDNDTLHTVKGKCHGIFLSLTHCISLWGFLKAQTGFSLILYTTTWSNYSWLFDFQESKMTKTDWIQLFHPIKTVFEILNETIYAFNIMWMSFICTIYFWNCSYKQTQKYFSPLKSHLTFPYTSIICFSLHLNLVSCWHKRQQILKCRNKLSAVFIEIQS